MLHRYKQVKTLYGRGFIAVLFILASLGLDSLSLGWHGSPAQVRAANANAGPTLSVNVAAGRQAIDPGIYGITFFWSDNATTKAGQLAFANAVKLPLNRNGGDATSRYNWQVDASNAGVDWYYMGGNGQANPTPGASVDAFVDTNRTIGTGAKSVLTIPTIQYINKSSQWQCSFPRSLYGEQQSFNPYIHPNGDDCGNGVDAAGNDLTDTHVSDHDILNSPTIQTSWVQHLSGKYGPAGTGASSNGNGNGIIYQLDNEPHNWGYMHRDVHPGAVTEQEIIDQNKAYAAAIKAADPGAWVAGPSEIQFGWYPDWGGDPNTIAYLTAMKGYEQQNGVRLIDSFDVHYPDANDNHWPNLTDIDHLKGVVAQNYPGTKISVSEWTGTGDNDLQGALFTADQLGVYARDGVAWAAYWGLDDVNSPAGWAYKLYRNYDGSGAGFGDTYVQSSSGNASQLSVYAAQRSGDNALTLLVLNKTGNDLTSNLALAGFSGSSSAKVYRYSGTNLGAIVPQADQPVSAGGFSATYPANSATLVVLGSAGNPTPTPTPTLSPTPTATPTPNPTPTPTPTLSPTPTPSPTPTSPPPTSTPTATPTPTPNPGSGNGNGTGLQGQYYTDQTLTTLGLTRTDSTVNFDWGKGSPDPAIPADHFSVRWSGQVQPRYSETYTFYTTSDDGVRLWVNGQLVIDNWTDHGPTENSGSSPIALVAGQKYDLKMEFYENGGGATAKLGWSSTHQAKEIVPQTQLYPVSGMGGGSGSGSGNGLKGQYYTDQTLTTLGLTRTDPTLNFDWGNGSPNAAIPTDHFSARWTGQIQPRYSETYTFYTTSDDGLRLWINGQLLVDNWTDHPSTEDSATITLSGGQKYDLKVEFYENTGGATAKLFWSSPSQTKEIVPQSQLFN